MYISKAELTCLHSCCCQDMGRDGEGGDGEEKRVVASTRLCCALSVFRQQSAIRGHTARTHSRAAPLLPGYTERGKGGGADRDSRLAMMLKHLDATLYCCFS